MRADRRRPFVAAFAVLVGFVALAGRAPLFGDRGTATPELPSGGVGAVSGAALVAGALLLAGYLLVLWLPGHRWRRMPDQPIAVPMRVSPSRAARAAMIAFPVLAVSALVVIASWSGGHATKPTAPEGAPPPGHATPAHRRAEPQRRPQPGPWVTASALVALAASGAWVAAIVLHRRRPAGPLRPAETQEARQVLGEIAGAASTELETAGDVRGAILRAYAAMTAAMEAHDIGRARTEGPREHIARVLPALGASGTDARVLERVFEVARYSSRPLGPQQRHDALGAFRAVDVALKSPLEPRGSA